MNDVNPNTKEKIMKLEIFAYYPLPETKLTKKGSEVLGTMHVFFPEFGLDVRSIMCTRKNGKYRCFFPSRTIPNEDGVVVRIPLISFLDRKKDKSVMLKCEEYVKKHYENLKPE